MGAGLHGAGIVPLSRQLGAAGGLLPFSDDFNRADGALGNGWEGATWTISGNKAVNTPTLGAELLLNPGFEGAYDTEAVGIDIAPNWNLFGLDTGSDTAAKEEAIIHGGSAAQKFVCDASGEGIVAADAMSVVAGIWYAISAWMRSGGGDVRFIFSQYYGNWQSVLHPTQGLTETYPKYTVVIPAASTGSEALWIQSSQSSGTYYVDDASVKALTFSSFLALRAYPGTPLVTAKALGVTITNLAQAGVVICADNTANPQNMVVGYFDRAGYGVGASAKMRMAKYVAGVRTELITVNTTYVAGADIEVRHTASTTFQLWYNNVQIDTDKTISDAGIINNTNHGLYSSDGGTQLDSFLVSAS